MNESSIKDAHRHTMRNRAEIEASATCGCINCMRIFPAAEVEDYVDEGMTALCPYCDCDSVIADGPDVKLTKELLQELNKKYF